MTTPLRKWYVEAAIRIITATIYGIMALAAFYLIGYEFTVLLALVLLLSNDSSKPPTQELAEQIRASTASNEATEIKQKLDEIKRKVDEE